MTSCIYPKVCYGFENSNVSELTVVYQTNSREKCGDKIDAFLDRTYYINGGYDNREGMSKLNALMEKIEVKQSNFYMKQFPVYGVLFSFSTYNLEAVDY